MTTQSVSTDVHPLYTRSPAADAAIAKHCEAVVARNPRGTVDFVGLAPAYEPDGTELLDHLRDNTT